MSTQLMIALVSLGIMVASATMTGLVRTYAERTNLLDAPNQRSSHSQPTPRGGGAAIFIASLTGSAFFWWLGLVETKLFAALTVGGSIIAIVGFIDDRKGVSPLARLGVHFVGAVASVVLLGGLSEIDFGGTYFQLDSRLGGVLAVVALIGATNLFNFMDGIDGIAGAEASFVATAAATLMISFGGFGGPAVIAFVLGSAAMGFLIWNWPPARIFMGDIGSGYLGFAFAVIALYSINSKALPAIAWVILGAIFFVDATLTLATRMIRGERVFEAHRTHAYQWLARKWKSHRRVTLLTLAINIGWLFPLAACAVHFQYAAPFIAVLALAPIIALCLFIGSGRPEQSEWNSK